MNDYYLAHRDELIRTKREVVRFNKKEMEMINEYCRRFEIKRKGAVMRRIILERILKDLDESNPSLF